MSLFTETQDLGERELAGGYRAGRAKPSCLTHGMVEEKGSERGRKMTKAGETCLGEKGSMRAKVH